MTVTSDLFKRSGRLRVLVDELAGLAGLAARVPLTEFGRVTVDHGLTEDEIDDLLELLDAADLTVVDDCARRPVATHYTNAELATRTTDALALTLRELPRHPRLGEQREQELVQLAASGDAAARTRLTDAGLRLIGPVAAAHEARGVTRLDLYQAGVVGLFGAVQSLDPACGVPFRIYAAFRIRASIVRAIADGGRSIRVPAADTAGAEPARKGRPSSRRLDQEDETAPGDVAVVLLGDRLPAALGSLTRGDAALIEARYGLDGTGPMAADVAAARLGIPRPQLLRRETHALTLLAQRREHQALPD